MIIFRRYLSPTFYLKRLDIDVRESELTEFSYKMVYILFLSDFFFSSFYPNWCYLKNRVEKNECLGIESVWSAWTMARFWCLKVAGHRMIGAAGWRVEWYCFNSGSCSPSRSYGPLRRALTVRSSQEWEFEECLYVIGLRIYSSLLSTSNLEEQGRGNIHL